MDESTSIPAVGRFYSRIARPYDAFASSPLFTNLRSEAVTSLGLDRDSRVLEVGCGTGGNVPVLEEWLGPDGSYVGLDASRGMLDRAAARDPRFEMELVQGDAARPPVDSTFDAVLVTFVSGVLADPGAAVETWLSLLRPGGRLVLLDAAGRSDSSTPLDWGFAAFVRLAAPPGTGSRYDRSPDSVLMERVETAHESLADRTPEYHLRSRWFGFVRLSVATVPSE